MDLALCTLRPRGVATLSDKSVVARERATFICIIICYDVWELIIGKE